MDESDPTPGPATETQSGSSAAAVPAGASPDAATPPTLPAPSSPAPAPGRGWLERIPAYVVPLLLIGIPVLVGVAGQLAPVDVGHNVIWKYYWGPIHADAAGHHVECLLADGSITVAQDVEHCPSGSVGTESGYNLVNTFSWAVLLGLCILGTAQLLARKKTVMDSKLIMGAVGWVVAGSVFHVLEDVKLFDAPLTYFFITPPIYLVFAAMGVATFVIGHYLKGVQEKVGLERALQKLWFVVALPIICYLMLWLPPQWSQVNAWVNPVYVAVFGLVAYLLAAVRFRRIGRIDPSELVGFMSIGWILLSLAYVLQFIQTPWPDYTGGLHPVRQALFAPVLAGAVALLIAGIARGIAADEKKAGKVSKWAAYAKPINILLMFSQLLDGFATSIGIDLGRSVGAGYDEKHVLSGNIITWTRDLGDRLHFQAMHDYPTFFGFLPVKLLVSLLVIYAIDVSNPKDAERYPTLIGLVKFAIIMVGLGPGIRDFVRMGLGV